MRCGEALGYRLGVGRKRNPDRAPFGEPKALVLYRTPERWRFAVYLVAGGILDGYLSEPDPACEPALAQAALERRAEELAGRALRVVWRVTDKPDWWTGEVVGADPAAA